MNVKGESESLMDKGRRTLPNHVPPMCIFEGHGGVPIAGDCWGDPNGPLVVLQHGGGQTRHAWKGTGQKLGREGYYAVAIDARGHGDSGWAGKGKYGVDFMVEDLRLIASQLRKIPILVGASMGGGTSLVAVGDSKLDATALVLVDMAPQIEQEGAKRIQEFMDQKPDGFDSLHEVADAIAAYQPQRRRPKSLDGLAKNVRLSATGKYVWHWDPEWRRSRGSISEYRNRLHRCANRLALPTLIVRGGLSDVLSEEGVHSFLVQCPHAEYVNVANAAHMVAGDRNDVFAAAVISFLRKISPTNLAS